MSCSVDVVDVPTYSPFEVDQNLSNFEVNGIGRLRFDGSETAKDSQEVV